MEKIHKLLKSKIKEDIHIGFFLLLNYSAEEILEFFKKHRVDPDVYGAYTISVNLLFEENPIPQCTYIDIGSKYRLAKASGDFRLRDSESDDYVHQHRIISKENFLNGVY